MGAIFSRENPGVDETDTAANNAYKYPPESGNYFSNHFIMGGERFHTTQPEAYLFGDNTDLNFLGSKPTPFPYPAPQPQEPTRTLRCLINIRKESIRFIRSPSSVTDDENSLPSPLYNIEFTFDADVRCQITIMYLCTEEITPNGAVYTPLDASMSSETYHYKRGANQQFSQLSHTFDPRKFTDDTLNYKFEDQIIPVLIQCTAEEGDEPRQSHMTLAIVEKTSESLYTLKPLKQKFFVDGLCYLHQEIYGIENKNVCQQKEEADAEEWCGDCCVCMSAPRDTLILPCRHLCLCATCADSLRFQASACPICRAPFRALLHIRAVRKSTSTPRAHVPPPDTYPAHDVPPGYEAVLLIEALNGPTPEPDSLVPAPIPPFCNIPDIRQKQTDKHSDEKSDPACEDDLPGTEVKSELSNHRKGCRTASAPEKIRLLASNNTNRRNGEKDGEAAETKSLLGCGERSLRPFISHSTPHSLHLCDRSLREASSGGEDSDYFTPEESGISICADQDHDRNCHTT